MTEQTENSETTETVAAPPPPNDVEDRARRMGWVPKEDFKGDPDRWRPADEFVNRGENILPILQQNLRSMEGKLSTFEKENRELKETLTEVRDFARNASDREYKRARERVQAEITEAAREANPERAHRAVQELEALDAGRKPAAAPPAVQPAQMKVDPDIQGWIERETWFTKSPALNGYATEVYGELEREAPGMSTAEKLAETKRRTVERFPDKFGVQQRSPKAAVASPSGGPQAKRGRSYDDLPADAKAACDKFVRTIKGYTREDYIRDFDWSSV